MPSEREYDLDELDRLLRLQKAGVGFRMRFSVMLGDVAPAMLRDLRALTSIRESLGAGPDVEADEICDRVHVLAKDNRRAWTALELIACSLVGPAYDRECVHGHVKQLVADLAADLASLRSLLSLPDGADVVEKVKSTMELYDSEMDDLEGRLDDAEQFSGEVISMILKHCGEPPLEGGDEVSTWDLQEMLIRSVSGLSHDLQCANVMLEEARALDAAKEKVVEAAMAWGAPGGDNYDTRSALVDAVRELEEVQRA